MTNSEWLAKKMERAGDFASADDFANEMFDIYNQELIEWLAMDGSMEWFEQCVDENNFKGGFLTQVTFAQIIQLKTEWESRK